MSDYRRKRFVDDAVVLLPENAPEEFSDRSVLWNAVEKVEKQTNAQLAREVEFALPVELPPEERRHLAIEFVQEQFVNRGMIADLTFHKQHTKKTAEVHLDANPHCHAMLTMRPLDENGEWEAKNKIVYLVEKNGERKLMTPEEMKENSGWEKLFSYQDDNGNKHWLTKSYVVAHPERGYKRLNPNPKRETIKNHTMAEWNSPEMLIQWRAAWAEKLNNYFITHDMPMRVDHRSYADQGLDIIPTVHEGKSVTAMERRYKEEYEARIARGEDATPRHTEVRELNLAIREHNVEVRMIAEIKNLREQLRQIVEPVVERLENMKNSVAETLERLRAEIVSLTVRIRKAVDVKGRTDEKIAMNESFLKDLAPGRNGRVDELRERAEELTKKLEGKSDDEKSDLRVRIDNLKNAAEITMENEGYADAAKAEIDRLKKISEVVGEQIEEMKARRDELKQEYTEVNDDVSEEMRPVVEKERLELRPVIESEYFDEDVVSFNSSAKSIDEELGCSYKDELSLDTKGISISIS